MRTQRRRFSFEESYWRVLVTSYGQCQNLLNEADHFERLKFSASAGHVLRLALSNLSKLDVVASNFGKVSFIPWASETYQLAA